ncbi:MAG: hypothetical protein FWC41_07715, partial [Firmicutes bacterium]|nr:hypothetical protein [Bacillota bacterium]
PYITDYEVHFIGNDKKELEIRGEYFYDLCSKIGRPQHQSGDKLDNIFTQNVKITQSYDSKKFVTIPYNSKDDYINKSLKFLIGEDKNSYFLLKTGNRIVISYDKSTLKISNKIDPVIKYINTITNYLEIKDIKNFKAIVTCGGDDSINEKLGDSFNDICFNDIYFDDEEEKEEEYEEPDYKEGDNKDYCFRSNDGRWSFVIEKENIDQISFKGQLSTEREVEILFNKIDEKIMDLKDSDEKPDYKNMTLLVDKESNITDMCFKKLRERFGQIPNYETFCLYDKKNENEKIFVEADFFENKKGEKEFIFKFFIGEKVKNKEDISIKSSGNGFSMVDISGEFDSKKVSIKFLLDTIEEKFGINFSKIKKESGIEDPDMYDTDAVKIRRSSKISDNCSIFKELKIEGFTIENGAKISKELLYKSEIDHLVSYLTDQIFDDSVDKESLSIKNIYVNSTKSIDGKTLFDKYSELFAGETTKLQVKHYKDVPSLTDIQMKHL